MSAGLLCFLFISCGTKYSKEIIQLDSLQSDLAKIQKTLSAIDTLQLQKTNAEMAEKLGFIQVNCTDTIDVKLAQTLDTYNSLRLGLIAILEQYHELKGDIDAEQQQITDLKHDLQYNLPDKNKVIDYCKAEQNAVEGIRVSVGVIAEVKEEKMKMYDAVKSLIDEEIQRIKECISEKDKK